MSEPDLASLNAQLAELNNRSRTYSGRLWQLPLAYLGAAGVALSQLTATTLPVGLLVTGLAGLLLGWHLVMIEDGRDRATPFHARAKRHASPMCEPRRAAKGGPGGVSPSGEGLGDSRC